MERTIIIAEAGVNHNGDINLAKDLIKVAAESGADIVKFQTFITEDLVSVEASKAEYQVANTGDSKESQFDMLKKLELSESAHQELLKYCDEVGIRFLSTPFDLKSVDFLETIGVNTFKIPSGEITNLPLLRKIGSKQKQVYLSTGMSSLSEIKDALNILTTSGTPLDDITVLHCNTAYPTPAKDVNLNAMITISESFNVKVGYSDHTLGIEVPIAAVALGADVIEKHFTLSRSMEGPDHASSLEPNELKEMVRAIRNVELAKGTGEKKPTSSEEVNLAVTRKSIHLVQDCKVGHALVQEDLVMKRPGDGISPMDMDSIIGKRLNCALPAGAKLLSEYLLK